MTERNDSYDRRPDDLLDAGRPTREIDEPLVRPDTPAQTRESVARSAAPPAGSGDDRQTPLFSDEETQQLRSRWESVQAGFVDEPRRAVEEADSLVRQVMDRLTDGFAEQREHLEREWGTRDEVSTEDLRMALRHYRSFFDRLLRL